MKKLPIMFDSEELDMFEETLSSYIGEASILYFNKKKLKKLRNLLKKIKNNRTKKLKKKLA